MLNNHSFPFLTFTKNASYELLNYAVQSDNFSINNLSFNYEDDNDY